jgi:alkanesulfonate monooxygenase SsuD/methylene tetrahydromethanopterin reductase-like flavin-dependent oxidoreductase (luciferase family)
LAKIRRSVVPAIVTDGSLGMSPGFRHDDTERSTPNVWRALMIAADEAEYQMGAVGDHAFIQVFCPTPQAISGRTKFVELFQPHAYCAWG